MHQCANPGLEGEPQPDGQHCQPLDTRSFRERDHTPSQQRLQGPGSAGFFLSFAFYKENDSERREANLQLRTDTWSPQSSTLRAWGRGSS